jgi:hypothetical protein
MPSLSHEKYWTFSPISRSSYCLHPQWPSFRSAPTTSSNSKTIENRMSALAFGGWQHWARSRHPSGKSDRQVLSLKVTHIQITNGRFRLLNGGLFQARKRPSGQRILRRRVGIQFKGKDKPISKVFFNKLLGSESWFNTWSDSAVGLVVEIQHAQRSQRMPKTRSFENCAGASGVIDSQLLVCHCFCQ